MNPANLEQLCQQGKINKTEFPGFSTPMLATLTKDYFNDPDWIYERKFDGMRCLIFKKEKKIELYSRNGKTINNAFPLLAERLLLCSNLNYVADGEIVAFEDGLTSFGKLQKRIHIKDSLKVKALGIKAYIYLFDLLYLDCYSLHQLPLKQRKNLLKKGLDWKNPVRFTVHHNKKGIEFRQQACKKGWEGIIAKDGFSRYLHGRSKKWLKFKCANGQELVIGGYTEPQGERKGFGALLVGFYEKGKLYYAGKVGTGFNDEFLEEWRAKFDKIEQKNSPFSNYKNDNKSGNHWLKPKYVGQFKFTEWTVTNKLRHPSFLGIRKDKDPKEIIKET